MADIYVLVDLGRDDENTIQYPHVWNSVAISRHQRGPLMYAPDYSQVLLCLPDAAGNKLASASEARIITEAQADAWLAANEDVQRMPVFRVTDTDRLNLIQLKLLRRLVAVLENINVDDVLTGEDAESVDPDSLVAGVNRVSRTAQGIFR